MKVSDLKKLPVRDWDKDTQYQGLYVINSGKKHDSGYALIYIIGINGEEMEIAAMCDDIVWDVSQCQKYDFRTDMLFPSGIIHYWSNNFNFLVGASLSSTDVTLVRKDGK